MWTGKDCGTRRGGEGEGWGEGREGRGGKRENGGKGRKEGRRREGREGQGMAGYGPASHSPHKRQFSVTCFPGHFLCRAPSCFPKNLFLTTPLTVRYELQIE